VKAIELKPPYQHNRRWDLRMKIYDADNSLVAHVWGNVKQSEQEVGASIIAALNAHDALVAALEKAKETIRAWHGIEMRPRSFCEEEMWKLYQDSPEMKQINAALELVKKEL
jgi:creatinine amidohydrolase/Fe(II)-dependent formamide hydrolase-like protein